MWPRDQLDGSGTGQFGTTEAKQTLDRFPARLGRALKEVEDRGE
jgi:hypothetical protein